LRKAKIIGHGAVDVRTRPIAPLPLGGEINILILIENQCRRR